VHALRARLLGQLAVELRERVNASMADPAPLAAIA
jgi:hypothetical protein